MNTSCQSFVFPPSTLLERLVSAALFESGEKSANALIANAERAPALRERALSAQPQYAAEREAVDAALLHSLKALKTCLRIKRSAIAA